MLSEEFCTCGARVASDGACDNDEHGDAIRDALIAHDVKYADRLTLLGSRLPTRGVGTRTAREDPDTPEQKPRKRTR